MRVLSVQLQGGAGPAASQRRVSTAKPLQHRTQGARVSSPVQRGGGAVGPWDCSIPRKGESDHLPIQAPLAGSNEDIDLF